jgi:hypothetical protein
MRFTHEVRESTLPDEAMVALQRCPSECHTSGSWLKSFGSAGSGALATRRVSLVPAAGTAPSSISRVVMSNESQEIRCTGCGQLLVKLRDGLLTVRRGDLQTTIGGQFHVSFVYHQSRCRQLIVRRIPVTPNARA